LRQRGQLRQQRADLGISDGMVRLSCGLEHPDDLIDDVVTALKAV
jgi:O-succinylhomoserine sulfhydrylase